MAAWAVMSFSGTIQGMAMPNERSFVNVPCFISREGTVEISASTVVLCRAAMALKSGSTSRFGECIPAVRKGLFEIYLCVDNK